ncbi:hypothetical protein FYJ37_17605 [[Clostridium] scindens]|uniref:Uncharacterized protein n=1 Tax=Clostridium scindens (strain JCM 10418 / VPI 12708) TaxID=29347 RepID=A0A844FDT1_CLOSV|nr:hypothetical protein [[Clostridium] scindens]
MSDNKSLSYFISLPPSSSIKTGNKSFFVSSTKLLYSFSIFFSELHPIIFTLRINIQITNIFFIISPPHIFFWITKDQ